MLDNASAVPFAFSIARRRSTASSCKGVSPTTLKVDGEGFTSGGREGTPSNVSSCVRNAAKGAWRSFTFRCDGGDVEGGLKTYTAPHCGIVNVADFLGRPTERVVNMNDLWLIENTYLHCPAGTKVCVSAKAQILQNVAQGHSIHSMLIYRS
jgi:hypothetical protein